VQTPRAFSIRLAEPDDVAVLNALIEQSARALSVGFYSGRQIDAAIRYVFGVDSSLIEDRSYFVAQHGAEVVGCGGWSQRRVLYGGDQRRVGAIDRLDPRTDAARVRAFFVAPSWARLGVGSALLGACARAAWEAGFRRLELMATLPGVPLYAARGFTVAEKVRDLLPDGTEIDFVRMEKPMLVGPDY
jgi:GNAT superfamily N-acetyltransferase